MATTPEQAQRIYQQARCLYDQQAVNHAVADLADKISKELAHVNPVVVVVMNGGMIPAAKLLERLDFPLQIDYLHASRYRDQTHGGQLDWIVKPQTDLNNRVVLVIDDILDEGITLQYILEYCKNEGAQKVYSCVLTEKQHDRKHGCQHADFVGLQVEDVYVFGCGMDYKGYLRNLPAIYAVAEK